MKLWKRRIALLLCMVLVTLPFVSMLFITTHIQHDCTGKHCEVCSEIELAVHAISNTRLILVVAGIISAAFFLQNYESMLDINICLIHKTLISLKVELLE